MFTFASMFKQLLLFILFIGIGTNLSFAADTLYINAPDIAFEGITTPVEIDHSSSGFLPEKIVIDGEVQEVDEGAVVGTFNSKAEMDIEGYVVVYDEQPGMVPLWTSILPPLIAIFLALIFKEVVFSLVSGIFIGAAIMGAYAEGLTGIFTGFFKIIDTYIINAFYDKGHLSVIIFSTIIGGIVALISKNGGMQGIVNGIKRFANTARNGQLATWFLGIAIFFDDYANTLVVGNTMRAVTDKLKVSREKLAYIVDSTAAPVSAIAFVTTWIGAELGYISNGLDKINADGTIVEEGVYSIFLNSLAYSFYPILTLFFVFYLIYRGREFGSMLKAERRARKGTSVNPEDNSGDLTELEDVAPKEGINYRAYNAVLPVAIIVFGTLVGLIITGFDALQSQLANAGLGHFDSWSTIWSNLNQMDPNIDSFGRKLGTLIGAADSYTALLWSSLGALFVAMMMTIGQKILSLKETVETTITGFKTMVPALLILVLAWSLAAVTDEMHTADFLTAVMEDSIAFWLIPAITFILAGFVAFSTGSSWSTMALVYPIILPAAWQIAMGTEGVNHAEAMSIFYNTVSAVLAGSVLGDHCSPISDTTILSSLASGCNHIDHVRTQIPYALTVGAIAVLFGTIPTALGLPPLLAFVLGIGAIVLVVEFVGKRVEDA